MTAYISVSFNRRGSLSDELTAVAETLKEFDVLPFVFVDNYKFSKAQEREMMEQAMNDIDKCDILIAETSDKGIGIGIEVGFAKAKGKPIIYLRNQKAEHSTTVSGISDLSIVYFDATDLRIQLRNHIPSLIPRLPL